jgi:hypothetical protein
MQERGVLGLWRGLPSWLFFAFPRVAGRFKAGLTTRGVLGNLLAPPSGPWAPPPDSLKSPETPLGPRDFGARELWLSLNYPRASHTARCNRRAPPCIPPAARAAPSSRYHRTCRRPDDRSCVRDHAQPPRRPRFKTFDVVNTELARGQYIRSKSLNSLVAGMVAGSIEGGVFQARPL